MRYTFLIWRSICSKKGRESPMRTLVTLVLAGVLVVLTLMYYSTQATTPAPSSTLHHVAPASPLLSQAGQDYPTIAREDAQAAGISPLLFVRQINEESGFNPNAVSPAGAIGIAQFMPTTAAGLGVNPWNPYASLQGAARLMASYLKRYGDYAKALAAYNAGSGRVAYALSRCGVQWRACVPVETQRYIRIIMR